MSMYPDMYDFPGMEDFGQMEDALIAFLGVYLVIMLISFIYSIVVYVLQSVGMYSIAKRRGIHHPWLAWIPVASMWILGSISDQYQYVAKNKNTNRRKVLLGLVIALYALLVLMYIFAFASIFGAAGSVVTQELETMIVPLVLLLVCYLALLVIAIILTVFQYIACYDLFVSSRPNGAVAFLVLGIFFSFLLPYFVFACRKKDDGMPARQAPVQPVAPQYIPAPVYTQPAPAQEPEIILDPESVGEVVADEADFELKDE